MTDIEKLRALLPHWIEHNEEHAAEFGRWAKTAASAGHGDAADMIRSAAQQMVQANTALQRALGRLGGPVSMETHDHTH
ncbi:MAG TPA: hypothetical protein VM366_14750 [Anaerolineae bacterium]|nr:hypothetical protein [Anaerolineae bacterium]